MRRLNKGLDDKLEVLGKCRYFQDFSIDVLLFLAGGMDARKYDRGEPIFWEGDAPSGLYIIDQGMVKLYKISPQGREFILNIKESGDFFNEVPVFDNQPNPVNVSAIQETIVWVVTKDIIQASLEIYPEIMRPVIQRMCEQLRNLVKILEELSFYQVTHRLARLIRNLPGDQLMGMTGERITQDEMAARLGTVREVVARSLRQLERSGAITTQRGKIVIEDLEMLDAWGYDPLTTLS